MAEAFLIILSRSPQRLNPIWRFGLTFPIGLILWYELAAFVLDRFSVALVALLLVLLYGVCVTLLTAKAVLELPYEPVDDLAISSKPLRQAIAHRGGGRQARHRYDPLETIEHDELSKGSQETLFPLRG